MGLGGRQVQANYPILSFFSSNYTLAVHHRCYSLAVVLIAHQSGLVFSPCSFLKEDPGSGGLCWDTQGHR